MIDTPNCFMLGKLRYTLVGGGGKKGRGGGGVLTGPPTDLTSLIFPYWACLKVTDGATGSR